MTDTAAPPYDVALFDLDGTLVDPSHGITFCLAAALESVGVEAPPAAHLLHHIGPPLVETLQSYGLDRPQVAQAVAVYREAFATAGTREMTVHAGMRNLLEDLVASGVRVGVATAKPWPIARDVLAAMDLLGLTDPVAGPDLDEVDAAKHLVIARALRELADPPRARVVMVGDRSHDVVGARVHGIDAVAVSWGFGSATELTASGPRHLVADVDELRAILLPGVGTP